MLKTIRSRSISFFTIAISVIVGSYVLLQTDTEVATNDTKINSKERHGAVQAVGSQIRNTRPSLVKEDNSIVGGESKQFQLDYTSPMSNMHINPIVLIGDLRGAFDHYYDSAMKGDAESLYNLAAVIENCASVDDIENVQVLDDLWDQAIIDQSQYESLRPLIPDCVYFQSKSPDGYSLLAWSLKLRADAAEGGQVIAKIRQMLDEPSNSESANKEIAGLLQEAVLDGDYRAYYLVSDYFRQSRDQNKPVNDWIVPTRGWQLLACKAHSECDETTLLTNIEIAYLPIRVEEILDYVADIEARIASHRNVLLPTNKGNNG